MSTHDSYVINDNAKFKRYLVGEMFWELEQHPPLPPEFANVAPDSVEVLMYRGYDDLRIRIAGAVYDVHISWTKAKPPVMKRL